jgi:glycosyltransferase involved in cell wall biosynthesis
VHRVALVASHPIQYHAPWFRALARVVDLEVFYCHRQDGAGQARAGFGVPFEWDVPLLDGYRFSWLQNVSASPGVGRFQGCDTPEIAERLRSGAFDACIVSGWYLKSYVQAIRACWKYSIPALVRGDSHLKTPRSRVKAVVKYLPYRWFLNRIDAHLYVGAANRRYLESYGVPADRLFFAPHFVDNAYFAAGAAQARQTGERERIRGELGAADGTTLFLFVGKFADGKRPGDFVDALATLASEGRGDVRGAMVGAGPELPAIEALARTRHAPIAFCGFRNQSELPRYYAAADVVVLPSMHETWGLVVNEAMACGVPVIVSDGAGCAEDLIDEGKTGFTFPAACISKLAERMIQAADMVVEQPVQVRANVDARIRRYSVDAAVDATARAIACVSERASMGEVVA